MSREFSEEKPGSSAERNIRNEEALFNRVMVDTPNRESFAGKVDLGIELHTKSIPAKEGETYSQVLDRMFPNMKTSELQTLAHDTAGLNQNKQLKQNEQFEILSDYGKKLLKEAILKDFDHKYGNSTDGKQRSRFSPAYEAPMRMFKEKISKEAEMQASRDSMPEQVKEQKKSSDGRLRNETKNNKPESIAGELHLFDTTDNAMSNKLSRPEINEVQQSHEDDLFSEQTLSNFVDSCHEFAKRSESLIFLSKWYPTDSHMYQWGEKKFEEAFQKSQQDFEKVQRSLKTEIERERIDKEWKGFLSRQKECLAGLNKTFSWLQQS